jgi:predicted ABC-type ATPase
LEDQTIRRRFKRGIENFFRLYRPLATTWAIYNNAEAPGNKLIASGSGTITLECNAPELWRELQTTYDS